MQSISFAKLLTAAQRRPRVRPALRLPLFDGGRLRANLAAKDADYDLAVEQYNQTLVDALREVVDQLASLRSVDAQRARARARARHARARPTRSRPSAIAPASPAICRCSRPRRRCSNSRILRANLRARELELSINLIRALGGGFEDAAPRARPDAATTKEAME